MLQEQLQLLTISFYRDLDNAKKAIKKSMGKALRGGGKVMR